MRPCLAVDADKPQPGPVTQPAAGLGAPAIDPAVRALIVKLGDDDPAVRDDATHKLAALGKPAVPALREAAEGDDPEARSRAKSLLHQIERHLPPPAPPQNGNTHSQSVRMSLNQGVRTIDVNDNGRKVHILCRADGGIEMSVTGVEDGKEATETYTARDAGELKKDNPEAFAIYDQWAGANGAMVINGVGGFGGGLHVQIGPGLPPNGIQPGGPLIPGPFGGVAPAQPLNPQDLQLRIEQQQRQIDELQRRLQVEAEQRVHDRMRGDAEKDQSPPAAGSGSDKKEDKPGRSDGVPAEKPQTRPSGG